jgi:hypothetical protein
MDGLEKLTVTPKSIINESDDGGIKCLQLKRYN